MNKTRQKFSVTLSTFIIGTSITACADMSGPTQPRRQLTECPPGFVLICESREQELSKGGAEEEIPQFEYCRCENYQ